MKKMFKRYRNMMRKSGYGRNYRRFHMRRIRRLYRRYGGNVK